MGEQRVDFAIITAVEVELNEVLRAFNLKDSNRTRKNSAVYWRGQLDIGRGEHYEIVVAQTFDMANVDTALITSDTIRDWDPEALLFVGIAGSAADEVQLGDIVVGRDIYYYERGKIKPGGKSLEPVTYRADATLFNNIRSMPGSKIPKGKKPDGSLRRPKVHYGVIASGEKVIADEEFRNKIVAEHRKILAVEMEGYGFSAAVWQRSEKKRHLVIRAICDRADRTKDDDWQPYAARIVSTYARNFLMDRPIPPINAGETKATRADTKAIKKETATRSPDKKSTRKTTKSSRTSGFDVFISYSHDDSMVTRKIHEALRERNVNAWIDYEQIKPGDVSVSRMEEGLTGSSSMILIVSPRSMESGWVEEEYVTGISLTKQLKGSFRLIPVLIEEAKLPAFLSNRSWVDLREENKFDDQLNLLAKTILEDRPVRTKRLAVSKRAKKHLEYVAFLIFFPEGILEPILNNLVDTSQGQNAIDWSMVNGFLQTINLSGLQLIRIFPEKVNKISTFLRDKPAAANQLAGQFINRIFLEENPFSGVVDLGAGRALLLRDLVEIAKISKSDTSVEQDKICMLARENLGRLIHEGFYRVALEICEGLAEVCGFTSPRDIITKANLLARIGQSKQAVQLFDLYRGDNLFEDSGLDDLDRIDATMSWAKAVKESGAAGESNAKLIAAYAKMLSLLDPVIASSKGMHSLLSLKADILNNRATQIAVYGTLEEWKRAREDFKLIFELYKQTGDDQRLIGAVSNYAAQTIDKSGNKSPFRELLSLFKKYDALANSMQPCEELFFYYYQKARLFKRGKPEHLSKAIEFYKISYDVALASDLKRRYPIAKRWQLVLRKRRNDISENDFLTGLSEAANTLRAQTQDSWALNALCDILIELAQTYKLRRDLEKAWGILFEAYQHRTAQFTHSGSPTAKRGIIKVLEEMDLVEVPPEKKAEFSRENNNTLNIVMGSPRARMLDWKSIHQWLGEQGR